MKPVKLQTMPVEALVERFAAICEAQDEALLNSELATFNRLYKEMRAVEDELKDRPGDQRQALLTLYTHPSAQVRLQSAGATLAVAPDPARQLIETLAKSRKFPQAGDAGMLLDGLERGTFKPN